jgi:hypothetical protein
MKKALEEIMEDVTGQKRDGSGTAHTNSDVSSL